MVPRAGSHRPTCPKPASRGRPYRGTGTEPARPNVGLGGGSDNDGRTPGSGTPGQHRHTCARQGDHVHEPGRSHSISHRPTDVHIRMICTHLPHRRFSWSAAHSRRSARPRVACGPDGVARSVTAAAVVSARWPGRGVDGLLPARSRRCSWSRRSSVATWRSGSARPPLRGPWLSLWLIHSRPGPFTDGRGPPVRAGHERWRTVVNGGAQDSKACEGASLPWVQIPPPPPLTCANTDPGG